MTQEGKVLEYLKKHGSITSLEMFDKFYVCCPHSIIRNIRKRFGYDYIEALGCSKQRKEFDDKGNERTVNVRYKQYFLKKLAS